MIRAEGEAIEHIYERMATPAARERLRRQHEATLTASMMT